MAEPQDSRDSRTTTAIKTRFSFFRVLKKIGIPETSFFLPERSARLYLLKKVKLSSDCKKVKVLTFDNLFLPPHHSR